jgi:hypothetical protein
MGICTIAQNGYSMSTGRSHSCELLAKEEISSSENNIADIIMVL